MNINEVHWNFSDNGSKEPAKSWFWNFYNFWTALNFLMRFSLLCSGEWALSFYMCVFIYIGVSLTSPTKLFTYKSCCFLTSALISLLKVSNFDRSLLLPVFFAFVWVLFFLRIFLLISGVIQGIEETDLLVFDGICLSTESWIKEVNKSKWDRNISLIIVIDSALLVVKYGIFKT